MIKHIEVKRAYYNDPENVVVQMKCHNEKWADMVCEPAWSEHTEYRIKPKTIRIGDIDVPEPVREALEIGQEYFVASPAMGGGSQFMWNGCAHDLKFLRHGLIHLNREAAELHAKALILVSGGTTDGIDSGR